MGTILSVLGSVIVKILLFLLFLFLFVLVLAGCILWVPVRYCFYGNYGEEKVLQGKASWLLHLVHAQIRYEEEWNISLRILGIDIIALLKKRTDKKAAQKAKKRKRQEKKAKKIKQPKESLQEKERSGEIQRQTESKEDLTIAQISDRTDQKISKESETSEQKESEETGKKKKRKISLIERIKKWIQTIKNVITLIRKRIRQAEWLKVLWQDDNTQAFVCILKDNVLHLWRHIKPKLLRIDMTIGFDDPAVTGQVLGVIAAFCGAAGIMPCVTPDFEKRVFESDIEIKGRVTVFILLKILIKVYFCEELKEFKKSYKSIREVL